MKNIVEHRLIIWQTVYLLCKYTFIHYILSDKNLLRYLSSKSISVIKHQYSGDSRTQQSISRSVNKTLSLIYPNGNCLVLSLIKRDILAKHGFIEPILFGLQNTDEGLKAHAWLAGENKSEYNLVYILQ